MGKNKNTELNFLYLDDKYNKDKKKNQVKKTVKKSVKQKPNKSRVEAYDDVFNFDDEIVIGVTKVENKQLNKKKNSKTSTANKKGSKVNNKKNIKKVKKSNVKKDKIKNSGAEKKSAPGNKKNKQLKTKDKPNVENATAIKVAKWIILMLSLGIAFMFFLLSPVFNIKEIIVTGNEKISTDTIISLSQIQFEDNIFRNMRSKIIKNIKQEAYIDKVNVIRKLPSTIELEITERKATFMIEYAGSYIYINNQGYILEANQNKLELPIIIGYITPNEEISVGKRLCQEDLSKLESILGVIEAIHSNEIQEDISRIDISNKEDYKLTMDGGKKVVHLGNLTNLSNRLLYLKVALQDTKGLEGEIFVNGNLNTEKAYFRQDS